MKKGRSPSLIGAGLGSPKIIQTPGKRTCKRCDDSIAKGSMVAEVSVPGTMGHKTFCMSCFGEILAKTQADLNKLTTQSAA